MHVTRNMLHKDVRLIGMLLRPFTSGMTEERFRKARENEIRRVEKKLSGRGWPGVEHVYLSRKDGSRMRMMILRPARTGAPVPVLLWLHGGGYVLGYPENELGYIRGLMNAVDCVVVSPDYRLGTEAPYPAALEDAYSALLWVKEHAGDLGGDKNRILVGGSSAGGGLTAALCILARDKGEVHIAFQLPIYPMLDDRGTTPSAKDNDAPMWDADSNRTAWKLYLGKLYGSADVPPTAAPARLKDFSGLPPAYSYVGTVEPFYDETRLYFEALRNAGVEAELDVYEGGFHGFDTFAEKKPLGREAREKLYAAFRRAAANYTAENR